MEFKLKRQAHMFLAKSLYSHPKKNFSVLTLKSHRKIPLPIKGITDDHISTTAKVK